MSMEEIIEKKMEEVTQGTEPAEEQEETIERPFTLRKLKDADLFPLLKIFRKCGLKDFKDVLQEATSAGNEDDGSMESHLESIGIGAMLSMADVVIQNIGGTAKDDIYIFIIEHCTYGTESYCAGGCSGDSRTDSYRRCTISKLGCGQSRISAIWCGSPNGMDKYKNRYRGCLGFHINQDTGGV